jgi:hypothetical protein
MVKNLAGMVKKSRVERCSDEATSVPVERLLVDGVSSDIESGHRLSIDAEYNPQVVLNDSRVNGGSELRGEFMNSMGLQPAIEGVDSKDGPRLTNVFLLFGTQIIKTSPKSSRRP